MPMKKVSTLIYFVTNFQPEFNLLKIESGQQSLENLLTTMENDESAPSEQTIKNILNYARSYEVLETENAGYVEMILN